jgi:hypothetical protein
MKVQFNYLLFMCRGKSYRAKYRHSTAQRNAVIGNYIMDKRIIKSRVNYRSTLTQKSKQTNMIENDNYKHKPLGLKNKI